MRRALCAAVPWVQCHAELSVNGGAFGHKVMVTACAHFLRLVLLFVPVLTPPASPHSFPHLRHVWCGHLS